MLLIFRTLQVKGANFEDTLTVTYQRKAGQFVVKTGCGEYTISDTINLAENIVNITVNGTKQTLQLVSKNSVGKIDLQYLGSVFPLQVYREDVYKLLPFMPEKKAADTSRQV